MKTKIIFAVGAAIGSSILWPSTLAQPSRAEPEGLDKLATLEKIAIVFTGRFPAREDVERVNAGTLDLGEYFESLRTRPEVERKLVDYWLSVLKINGRFDTSTVSAPNAALPGGTERLQTQATNFTFAASRLVEISTLSSQGAYVAIRNRTACPVPRVTRVFRNEAIRSDAAIASLKSECQQITDVTRRDACVAQWTRYETVERPAQLQRLDTTQCECGTETEVQPWWNPSTRIRACQDAVTACGPALENCEILDDRFDTRLATFGQRARYQPNLNYGTDVMDALTLEPGILIARNIVEKEDFRRVLTSTHTYLNGAAEHYLSGKGSLLVRNGPPNSYKNSSGASTLVSNQPSRRTYRKLERGTGHAGILTTPMFHQVTNGYRAKVNRVYEGFLCNRFVISANVPASPSNVTNLEQREPCAQCHRIIEPMGRFLGRWEQEGLNYLYRASRPANGSYGGHSGADALGLGTAVSVQPQFETCAVQRAFEIAMGREMSEPEARTLLPQLLTVFQENNRQMWPVLKALVTSAHFKGTLQ